ncbi:DUF2637 domain-containing protein [Streptomyces sp. NPDC051572]|uniref:DUF2637 domain-containing protein n=1 Tax=Streptomyces sp. NPDC051572 TaxID=3155802 RepID=UPI00344E2703
MPSTSGPLRGCALVVAGVAAYASYVHQREFARQGGADTVSSSLWPVPVDGLLLLATVGLLKPSGSGARRERGAVWSICPRGMLRGTVTVRREMTLCWRGR